MLRRRIGWAVLLLVAVLLAAFFESFLTGFVLALTVALPVLAFLLSLPAMLELRVHLTPQLPSVQRGGAAAWRLELDNRYGLSISRTDLRLSFRNRMTGTEARQRLRLLGAPMGGFLTLPADTAHCGLLEARVTRVRVCDCLGLFALRRDPPAPALLPVLPLQTEPEALPEVRSGPVSLTPRPGGGPGEDYDIRPYRPGDPVRMIHWKLSCKRDEPVLREVLGAKQAEPVLTFDHFGRPEVLDAILDRLNALSLSLLEQQRPHTVQWLEQEAGILRTFRVESQRELSRCLAAVLSDAAPLDGIPTPRGRGALCYHLAPEDMP